MTVAPSPAVLTAGSDCTAAFRAAYDNRYTWAPGFAGYSGRCVWEQGDQRVEGIAALQGQELEINALQDMHHGAVG